MQILIGLFICVLLPPKEWWWWLQLEKSLMADQDRQWRCCKACSPNVRWSLRGCPFSTHKKKKEIYYSSWHTKLLFLDGGRSEIIKVQGHHSFLSFFGLAIGTGKGSNDCILSFPNVNVCSPSTPSDLFGHFWNPLAFRTFCDTSWDLLRWCNDVWVTSKHRCRFFDDQGFFVVEVVHFGSPRV